MDEEAVPVGIIGSGAVGRSLAEGFLQLGHPVMIGTRLRDTLEPWLAEHPGAQAGSDEEAARFGEIVVFAVRWTGAEEAAKLAGPANVAGKIMIDATNPLHRYEDRRPPSLELGWNDSAGEQVQRWFPEARVVKCFNAIGYGDMVGPQYPGGPPTMFFCGDDRDAKHEVELILEAFGWEWVDLGGLEESRLLEPLALIWIHVREAEGPAHAFKLLRR